MYSKVAGIYTITNRFTGKVYVGSSCYIAQRWSLHRSELRAGKHHSILLQRAWNKYGEDAFVFEVVEECAKDVLFEREAYHLALRDSANPKKGYNTLVKPGSGAGYRHTPEAKAAMSEKQRAIPYERRLGFCRSFLGRKHTEETKAKMSAAARGRKASAETRAKIGAANRGRRHTAEARAQMSAKGMGRCPTDETRAKLSKALKGRTITPEWRAKLSEAAKRRTTRPRSASPE